MPEEQQLASDAEIERRLHELMSPIGGGPHLRDRERALDFLLEHAEQSHPRLLTALRANPTALNAPAIIEVLPLFGLEDSLPLLEEIMFLGAEIISRSAGLALGRHPSAEAGPALLRGLQSEQAETIISAADGLAMRTDINACDELVDQLRHDNATVRHHVLQAADKLRCVGPTELANLAAVDPDVDVRSLATNLMSINRSEPPA
ncbi:MAG TPA: hypothetical protein VGO68_21375 [Pyrinomonadaceae bacterium]|jgi:HEAT repeat protein|nr:hypothetical protein [Pyrinomonadaceae bacterium]